MSRNTSVHEMDQESLADGSPTLFWNKHIMIMIIRQVAIKAGGKDCQKIVVLLLLVCTAYQCSIV